MTLIEVNTSPALARSGHYLADLLPRVLEEVIQKAVDPWFPPPAGVPHPRQLNGFQPMKLITPAARQVNMWQPSNGKLGTAASPHRSSSDVSSRFKDRGSGNERTGGGRSNAQKRQAHGKDSAGLRSGEGMPATIVGLLPSLCRSMSLGAIGQHR